jgi:glycosyltransferase involved in cell wall biosynthesis
MSNAKVNAVQKISEDSQVTEGGERMRPSVTSVALGTLTTVPGGVWRHVEDLAVGLRDRGVEVCVCLKAEATVLQTACRASGLRWEPIGQMIRADVDLWHLHLEDTFSREAMRLMVCRRPVGRTIITEHLPRTNASDPRLDSHFSRRPGAYSAKSVFKRAEFALATHVIAVSRGSAHFLTERYGLSPQKISVIPNGIAVTPAALRSPSNRREGPIKVVAIGSLSRQKGHDILIEAARLSSGNWTTTIVGTGAQFEALYVQAGGLPRGRVRLVGWLDDPRTQLIDADVVCMPSRWEAFPYSALEGAAMGLAVVATRIDGLEDIVIDGVTGVLIAPDDAAQLAAVLDALAARPRDLLKMGESGRSRVIERFGLARMVDETLAAYRRALIGSAG